jgi:DNA invertase Pin-like site-specific DNA recombinase
MSAAAYIRVSSLKGQKTDAQRAELEAWARRQRLNYVEWFEDRETGRHLDRPAFLKLQSAIFAGHIDTVMVWKLFRCTRASRRSSPRSRGRLSGSSARSLYPPLATQRPA